MGKFLARLGFGDWEVIERAMGIANVSSLFRSYVTSAVLIIEVEKHSGYRRAFVLTTSEKFRVNVEYAKTLIENLERENE